jgi:cytochrome c peroxidase
VTTFLVQIRRPSFVAWAMTAVVACAAAVLAFGGVVPATFGQDTPPTQATTKGTSRPTTQPTTRALPRSSFTRIPPRPLKSEAEYKDLAAELRTAYQKPRAEWPKPTIDEDVELAELAPVPKPEFPKDNPYTKEKAELGQQLFFDPRLSGSGQIACASCHDPELGWGDGRAVSFGHKRQSTKRNAPQLLTAAYGSSFFWDGRVSSLEEQAKEPILAAGEMAADGLGSVLERLAKVPGYRDRFKAAFGSEDVTFDRAAQAIATFERSIVRAYGGNKFDRFLRGESAALPDDAVRGLHLFRTDARCINCHSGPLLTDGKFHDVGLSYYGRSLEDLGRYNITKRPEDVGAFRTPTLRNIARTAPYMHNGLFELDGVLNMYNAGMPTLRPRENQVGDPLFPKKSSHLKPLGLNRQDLSDLKAFLESLSERKLRIRWVSLPEDGGPGATTAPAPAAGAPAQPDEGTEDVSQN